MSRVKRGVTSHARHKKVLSKAKGYYGRNSLSLLIELFYGVHGKSRRVSHETYLLLLNRWVGICARFSHLAATKSWCRADCEFACLCA